MEIKSNFMQKKPYFESKNNISLIIIAYIL